MARTTAHPLEISSSLSGRAPVRRTTVGITSANTANNSKEYCVRAPVGLNRWVVKFTPPQKKHMPRTSRRFDTMLPTKLPFTTSVRPSRSAKMAMIISTALPKVAFNRPPKVGPTEHASCSVASPSSLARGTIAKKLRRNVVTSPQPSAFEARPSGVKTSITLRGDPNMISFSPSRSCSKSNQASSGTTSEGFRRTRPARTSMICLALPPLQRSAVILRRTFTANVVARVVCPAQNQSHPHGLGLSAWAQSGIRSHAAGPWSGA
mmetsp:Transcript_33166/g.76627  ORF Transcript_33166/g.76627 Transcript_33166/m.76627 type:complete len:264 (-) Transcript_33166:27-818(-)